jgi:uncharacterized delta-60 repeat protein
MQTGLKRRAARTAAAYLAVAVLILGLPLSAQSQSAGDLDDDFGAGGIVTTMISSLDDEANGVAVYENDQGDLRIVVVGTSTPGTTGKDFAIARYTEAGDLDSNFGNGGIVTTSISNLDDIAYDVAVFSIQNETRIVVVGSSQISRTPSNTQMVAALYSDTGSPVPTFGNGGIFKLDFTSRNDAALGVAVADGKIILAGFSNEGGTAGSNFALVRIDDNGKLDPTFDGDGRVEENISNQNDLANSVVIQTVNSSQKIVVAGTSNLINTGTADFTVLRFNSDDGSLDLDFGPGGTGIATFDFNSLDDIANAVTLQGNNIVVGGVVDIGSTETDFGILILADNGKSLIAATRTNVSGLDDEATALVVDADQKIIAIGFDTSRILTSISQFAVVRYESNLDLDQNFGSDGIVETNISALNDRARAVAIQNDGKIVVAGTTEIDSRQSRFAIVRYLGEGTNDNGLPTGAGSGGCFIDAGRTGFLRNPF